MFGKLLKNDLKAQWFSVSLIYLCAFIVCVALEIGANVLEKPHHVVLCGAGVVLVLLAASVVTLFAVAVMFRNTMFGKSGYLTLTLPVKTGSLLASKTLSGLIWIFGIYSLFIGGFILWLYQVKLVFGEEMAATVDSLLEIFGVPSVRTITLGTVLLCIFFIAFILLSVQALYLALTLSQIKPFNSFGAIGTIILFFALTAGLLFLGGKVSDLLPFNVIITETYINFTTIGYTTDTAMNFRLTDDIFNLVAAIALHFPMKYLIKKKINLK